MNKYGYQPLPVLLRAEPDDARRTSKSTKILGTIATLGTLFAVCGAIAICLVGFNAFPRRTLEMKAPADVHVFSETPVSPSPATNHGGDGTGILPQDSNQALPGMIAEDHSIIDQTATPAAVPTSTPVAAPQPEASPNNSELLNEAHGATAGIIPDRSLPESVRKKLEKMRRAAEHHRSRLEELFEKRVISVEAYKKGEEKYQREIDRYRKEISARTVPANNVAGQN
jgi:hypothetical protein